MRADIQALMDHALALEAAERTAETIAAFETVLALDPNNRRALRGLAAACISSQQPARAKEILERVLTLEPGLASAHLGLGHLAYNAHDMPATARHFEAARTKRALDPEAAARLGVAYTIMDRYDDARAIFLGLLANAALPFATVSPALMMLAYDPGFSPRDLAQLHRKVMARFTRPAPAFPARRPGRIRIGYVSSDFYTHVCASFLLPILQRHDRQTFEIFCYAGNTVFDAYTERFKALAQWREIAPLGDPEAAEVIRADGIDVLVDCSGHTENSRLSIFAHKPAPVQVSYLAYPETTGLDAVDYRFTDAVADPLGEANFMTEKLVRLPHGFMSHRPLLDQTPPVNERLGRDVVFGSFNNWSKVTPAMRALWAEILRRTPGSTLVLKDRALQAPDLAATVKSEFAAAGIAPERIDIKPRDPSQWHHMAQYNAIDIALDACPYNGGTTTCDALWMGVPVITLRGARHIGRMTASILTQVGLTDLITDSADAYIRRAVELAADAATRARLRRELRGRFEASPAGNAEALTRDMEAFYKTVVAGHPPP